MAASPDDTRAELLDRALDLFAAYGYDGVGVQQICNAAGVTKPTLYHHFGSKRGILRAGYFVMPMDESLGVVAVDFGGRSAAVIDTKMRTRLVGDLQAELVPDFFDGFARGAKANVHARVLYGRSSHHKIEALFKAFARALRVACSKDRQLGRMLPSTKGLL